MSHSVKNDHLGLHVPKYVYVIYSIIHNWYIGIFYPKRIYFSVLELRKVTEVDVKILKLFK